MFSVKQISCCCFNLQESNLAEGDQANQFLTTGSSHTKGRFSHANKGQLSRSFVSEETLFVVSCVLKKDATVSTLME